MDIISSIFSFIVTIIILVTVHEFGHFWVAKKLGVKVLKFSIGFGKPLFTKKIGDTEFILAIIPLGGYVKMLDSREANVAEEDLPQEFNSQPLLSRAAIVAAGPIFNFILAILLYWLVFIVGATGLHSVVGSIEDNSIASAAKFQNRDQIIAVEDEPIKTWNQLLESLTKSAPYQNDIKVTVIGVNEQKRELLLDSSGFLQSPQVWLNNLGLTPLLPKLSPSISQVLANYPAAKAGLKPKDTVIAINGIAIKTWQQLTDIIKVSANKSTTLTIRTQSGIIKTLSLVPVAKKINSEIVGQIGAVVMAEQLPDGYLIEVKYGVIESFGKAITKTWQFSKLTLIMMGKMLVGDISAKENIGGPISIAKFASNSLFAGFTSFLAFLAVISISLGVLNLLPVPVLDGGHLFLYLIEFIKGSPVSSALENMLQKLGMSLLIMLMVYVIYNDISKLI